MWITEVTNWGDKRQYQVVDKIPDGYDVWNIAGINGNPEYLPLCVCYEGTYTVMIDRLLAIKIPEADQKIMYASSMWGAGNLIKARRLLKRKNLNQRTRERIEKALPLFEKYTDLTVNPV